MNTYTIRLKHDGGVVAITTTASVWKQAVAQVLKAEGAPDSAYLNCFAHMQAGEALWNGATASKQLAAAYNATQDHIHAWKALGKQPPEQLLNGAHNLLASAGPVA
jgi:hypothetical protein